MKLKYSLLLSVLMVAPLCATPSDKSLDRIANTFAGATAGSIGLPLFACLVRDLSTNSAAKITSLLPVVATGIVLGGCYGYIRTALEQYNKEHQNKQ